MIEPSQYAPSSARERTDRFCRQFGLRIPILQAPMASASPPSLAAAVANAGGMGALGALVTSPPGNPRMGQRFPFAEQRVLPTERLDSEPARNGFIFELETDATHSMRPNTDNKRRSRTQ